MHKKSSQLTICIKSYQILTICMKNHDIKTIRMKNHYTNIMRINIFVVSNQINKHKARIYDQCMYTLIIIKTFHNYIKKKFHLPNIKTKKLFC